MTSSLSKGHCPVCKNQESKGVARIKGVPALCNFFYSSASEARAAERADIDLVLCTSCSHMYNRLFTPETVIYQPGYGNSLHHSSCYRAYAREQAGRLLKSYDLQGRKVVDIGCGKGEFLQLLNSMGGCVGTGFEPAASRATRNGDRELRIIAETFSEKYYDSRAKCYISRHVLEHLPDPVSFLATIRMAITDEEVVLYLEVPNGSFMLEECSVWDVIYEHYSYFTPQSLQYILYQSGFSGLVMEHGFGGQYLCVDAFAATTGNGQDTTVAIHGENGLLSMQAEKFSRCLRDKNDGVSDLLQKQVQSGKKVVLWGAGSKGVSLLNQLSGQGAIQYVVDMNPEKQGKFIPGSGQQVVAPEFLTDFQPDMVLIMNSMYEKEIEECLDLLQVSARIESP